MNGSDASLLIVLIDKGPIDSAVIGIFLGLNIEYAGDASFLHRIGVLLSLRVGTDPDLGCTNFVESKTTDEVGICHFDVAIDDKSFVNVAPDIGTLLSELAIVSLWVLDVETPAWFPLPNVCTFLRTMN